MLYECWELYEYKRDRWRCPQCIWQERMELLKTLEEIRYLLSVQSGALVETAEQVIKNMNKRDTQ